MRGKQPCVGLRWAVLLVQLVLAVLLVLLVLAVLLLVVAMVAVVVVQAVVAQAEVVQAVVVQAMVVQAMEVVFVLPAIHFRLIVLLIVLLTARPVRTIARRTYCRTRRPRSRISTAIRTNRTI
jgi:hypothetical protein